MAYCTDEEFERVARDLRIKVGVDDQDRPYMVQVLATAKFLGLIKDYVIVDDSILRGAEAQFNPQEERMYVTRRTFAEAERQVPRARFAIAHEFGHSEFDHTRTRNRSINPRQSNSLTPAIQKDENEANRFAGAFLIPCHRANYLPGMTAGKLAERFKVSSKVAEIQLEALARMYRRKNGIIRPLPPKVVDFLREAQRKGHQVKSLEEHDRVYGVPKEKLYEGEQCPCCHQFMLVRRGTIMKCDQCGTTTGVD